MFWQVRGYGWWNCGVSRRHRWKEGVSQLHAEVNIFLVSKVISGSIASGFALADIILVANFFSSLFLRGAWFWT